MQHYGSAIATLYLVGPTHYPLMAAGARLEPGPSPLHCFTVKFPVYHQRSLLRIISANTRYRFPAAPGLPKDAKAYLKHVEDVYVTDAYHSLSIEGYGVNLEVNAGDNLTTIAPVSGVTSCSGQRSPQ